MNKPGIWSKLVAFAQGEVNTELLEAYRRAGSTIHEQLDRAEKHRFDLKVAGKNPWEASDTAQLELLCTWNAFALQSLGDEFLDADYKFQPVTAGFAPRVTADQVQAFYGQVEGWLSRARQASSNPKYTVDVTLPASLPPWTEVEPCPRPHLEAMMAALKLIRLHAEAALIVFEGDSTPPEKLEAHQRLRQMAAEANTKADYVDRLWQPNASLALHERIEEHAKKAVEIYYQLGQYVSMPRLLEQHTQKSVIGKTTPMGRSSRLLPLPTEPGFDMWCMTDPSNVASLKKDKRAVIVMKEMWHYNPDPRRTLELFQQIEDARARGDVDIAKTPNGTLVGHYFCTPWAPIYVAKRPVTIGGERLGTAQQFTLEAAAEGVLVGEEFKLEIVKGTFHTAQLDYCDPREPSPHDD